MKDSDIEKVTRGLFQIPMIGGTIAFGYNYDCDLKLSDLEKRGIADEISIAKIANDGIGFMKGYKNKLKNGEDKVLAQWIIQNAEIGWE